MSTPTVKNGYLFGTRSKYPLALASPGWLRFLRRSSRFKIQTAKGLVSVYKIHGYWIAQKRIDGKLHQKRLGRSEKVAYAPAGYVERSALQLLC